MKYHLNNGRKFDKKKNWIKKIMLQGQLFETWLMLVQDLN